MVDRSLKSDLGKTCIEGRGDALLGPMCAPGVIKPPVWFKLDGGLLTAFSIMACAFLCHFNVIPTRMDLQDPTRSRLKCIISTTMGCANLLYVVIACFG